LTQVTIEQVRKRAESDAKTFGYYLTPDSDLLQGLFGGLKVNEERYGYPSCPCRLAAGKFDYDRDIICPCDYRDPDVAEFGACYCRLYVSRDVYEGKTELPTVAERRPLVKQARAFTSIVTPTEKKHQAVVKEEEMVEILPKIWYCKQCGYMVFREEPPFICPICKAKKELFAEIKTRIVFRG
jgi:ferredoxin-thioredoxin reductase catalytic subunit